MRGLWRKDRGDAVKRTISLAAVLFLAMIVGGAQHIHAADESAESAAMKALDEFMETFNARDAAAWAKTLNYPHVRIAGGDVRVWQSVDEFSTYMDFDRFVEQTGWDHSAWDERTIVQSGEDKVHIAVQFSRYDKDDQKIATYESLYVVTNRDGHWGTQARSSFAP